jgi:hypothetical protein
VLPPTLVFQMACRTRAGPLVETHVLGSQTSTWPHGSESDLEALAEMLAVLNTIRGRFRYEDVERIVNAMLDGSAVAWFIPAVHRVADELERRQRWIVQISIV